MIFIIVLCFLEKNGKKQHSKNVKWEKKSHFSLGITYNTEIITDDSEPNRILSGRFVFISNNAWYT